MKTTRVVLTHIPTGRVYVAWSAEFAQAVKDSIDPQPHRWHLSWERKHKGRQFWGSL